MNINDTTIKKMQVGLWLMKHRKDFKKILIIFLIFISTIFWSYTIYNFGYYFIKGMDEDKLLVKKITETQIINHDYLVKISAKNLIYSPINILKSNNNYDLLIQITNPNQKYWANYEYCFLLQNKKISCAENFILPNQTKYLMSLANDFQNQPKNIKFVINNILWERINQHKFPNWKKFADERLDISVKDIKFNPAQSSGLSEKLNLNSLEFTAQNNTAYNYWEILFNIILLNNNSIVGVNQYTLLKVMSGEERHIQINWLGEFNKITTVKIIPDINIMKDNIYIPYEGGIGIEK